MGALFNALGFEQLAIFTEIFQPLLQLTFQLRESASHLLTIDDVV